MGALWRYVRCTLSTLPMTSRPVPVPSTEAAPSAPAFRYQVLGRLRSHGPAARFDALSLGRDGFARRVVLERPPVGAPLDAPTVAAFSANSRLASQLRHTNIIGVIDYDVDALGDGAPFRVLDLVDGPELLDLAQRARRQGLPMPASVAAHVVLEVAHALAYAVSARDADGRPLGARHPGLSDGTVFLSWSGDVRVCGFVPLGAVREASVGPDAGAPVLGAASGSVSLREEVDPGLEVYALGVLLESLLTAPEEALAFDGDATQRVRGVRPVPEALQEVVATATAPAWSDRYPDVRSFVRALWHARMSLRDGDDGRSELCDWLGSLIGAGSPPASLRDVSLRAEALGEGSFDDTEVSIDDIALDDLVVDEAPADFLSTQVVRFRVAEPDRVQVQEEGEATTPLGVPAVAPSAEVVAAQLERVRLRLAGAYRVVERHRVSALANEYFRLQEALPLAQGAELTILLVRARALEEAVDALVSAPPT